MLTDFAPDTASFYTEAADVAFAHLRTHDPVYWYEPGGFWCLTRQAEIREVSRQPLVFSSASGLQMWQIPTMRGAASTPTDTDGSASIHELDPRPTSAIGGS